MAIRDAVGIESSATHPFPSTRYQGSKRKLTNWIWDNIQPLEFDTVLDAFGGTGAVSHLLKRHGKQVIYNDLLAFNYNIGLALIENHQRTLSTDDVDHILSFQPKTSYPDFIQRNFQGIYFTDDENAWLDKVIYNINALLTNRYQKALARFALFQACIIKRPYNLFHRANLYMRTAQVERSFGNKKTWDTPFEMHFRHFVSEANRAVFDNGRVNQAIQVDALKTPTGADLVYIDPPYVSANGIGVDYRDFYHFLEGLVNYDNWLEQVDYESKHRRLKRQPSRWTNASMICHAFEQLIAHHRHSHLVISYRDDGIPSQADLVKILKQYKSQVEILTHPKQYVLSQQKSHEMLLVAT